MSCQALQPAAADQPFARAGRIWRGSHRLVVVLGFGQRQASARSRRKRGRVQRGPDLIVQPDQWPSAAAFVLAPATKSGV